MNHRTTVAFCPWLVLQEAAGHAHHSRREMLDASQLFTGLLEMGGASMQLTFLPHAAEQLPEKHGGQLHLPGRGMPQLANAVLCVLPGNRWRACCSAASGHVVGFDATQANRRDGSLTVLRAPPGVPSRLYAHSYLGLGMDSALEAAEERVAAHVPQEQRGNGEAWLPHGDPCLPIGCVTAWAA